MYFQPFPVTERCISACACVCEHSSIITLTLHLHIIDVHQIITHYLSQCCFQECADLSQRLTVEARLKSSHADEVSVVQTELGRERESRARELADLSTKHLEELQQTNTQHAQKVGTTSTYNNVIIVHVLILSQIQ